jgi:hypothetical protein
MTNYEHSDGGASCYTSLIIAVGNGEVIDLDEMLVLDHTSTGIAIKDCVAGENVTFGNLCYFKSDNKFWKTDADAKATTEGELAIALETITAESAGKFLKIGYIRDDSWTFVIGDILYVDTTTGAITATKPSTVGDSIRRIGYAHSATIIWFAPDLLVLEL